MTVYYVYRGHENLPTGKHVARFEQKTILEWFQAQFRALRRDQKKIPGLAYLFQTLADHPYPASFSALERMLCCIYSKGDSNIRPDCIQLSPEQNISEPMSCHYIFDDWYLRRSQRKADYLLWEPWELPVKVEPEGHFPSREKILDALHPLGEGKGTTYLVFDVHYEGRSMTEVMDAFRLPGIRLPDLSRYLITALPEDYWPEELLILRCLLLHEADARDATERGFHRALDESPTDSDHWDIYSDWLEDRDEPPAHVTLLRQGLRRASHYPVLPLVETYNLDSVLMELLPESRAALDRERNALRERETHQPEKTLIQVEEHVAQICLHVERVRGVDYYHRWIFFDDLWAAAHKRMADDLLIFAEEWQILEPASPPR